MKLRMGRVELLTGLQRVQGVVEKRNTMPILSNILIEAKQEGVEIVATDLEIVKSGSDLTATVAHGSLAFGPAGAPLVTATAANGTPSMTAAQA